MWIPLTVGARLDLSQREGRVFTPGIGIPFTEHVKLQQEVERLWNKASSQSRGADLRTSYYDFSIFHTIRLSTEMLIRRTINELLPQSVLLPSRCVETSWIPTSTSEMLEWIVYRVLEEETRGFDRKFFEERHDELRSNNCSSNIYTSGRRDIHQLRGSINELLRTTVRQIRRWSRSELPMASLLEGGPGKRVSCIRRGRRSILVLGQKPKVEAILRRRFSGWKTYFVSIDRFLTGVHPNLNGDGVSPFWLAGCDTHQGIESYLLYLSAELECARSSLEVIAGGRWDVLLTDSQHDSHVQTLITSALARGKRVALVPEGAVKYSSELEVFGKSLEYSGVAGVNRFVLDDEARMRWIAKGMPQENVATAGFLGNTSGGRWPWRWRSARQLDKELRKMAVSQSFPTVLISIDVVLSRYEMARFGRPTWSELWDGQTRTLESLVSSGYRVLASVRDPILSAVLTERFSGFPVLVTANIPWQTLAEQCQVVITRDSSIGWESLTKCRPVIVWNYSNYPSFAEIALRGLPQAWVKVVRSPDEVVDAVRRITLGPAERSIAPVTMKIEAVAEWLARLNRS